MPAPASAERWGGRKQRRFPRSIHLCATGAGRIVSASLNGNSIPLHSLSKSGGKAKHKEMRGARERCDGSDRPGWRMLEGQDFVLLSLRERTPSHGARGLKKAVATR